MGYTRRVIITLMVVSVLADQMFASDWKTNPTIRRILKIMEITGRVNYPDGTPAAGATVHATSTCKDEDMRSECSSVADTNGQFVLEIRRPVCGDVRFTAEHPKELFLRTGDDTFYRRTNGFTPKVHLPDYGDSVPPVDVPLAERGGEVQFYVYDEATRSFSSVLLSVENDLGAVWFRTKDNGEPTTSFLPPGNYRASIVEYACFGKVYFAAETHFPFRVMAGKRMKKTININIFKLKAVKSYDNPSGERCWR